MHAAITKAGFTPPSKVIPDGCIHRFPSHGKPGNRDGWYVLHTDADPPYGAFGDWHSGYVQGWRADTGRTLTVQERQQMARQRAAALELRKAQEARARDEARSLAGKLWQQSSAAPPTHAYLSRKQVPAHDLRLYLGDRQIGGMSCHGALIVPMLDASGELSTLEFIQGDGQKRWLPGGAKEGAYYRLGTPAREHPPVIVICEGYATGATLHAATGWPVAVAGDAGNLTPVARALRARYPGALLVIGADHDLPKKPHPEGTGQAMAAQAAAASGALIALPEAIAERRAAGQGTDWNDVHVKKGLHRVRTAFDDVLAAQQAQGRQPPGQACVRRTGGRR